MQRAWRYVLGVLFFGFFPVGFVAAGVVSAMFIAFGAAGLRVTFR